jgi:hypothetical protein
MCKMQPADSTKDMENTYTIDCRENISYISLPEMLGAVSCLHYDSIPARQMYLMVM